MDVGNPSNFVRMLDLFQNSREEMAKYITAFSFSDEQTRQAMQKIFLEKSYVLDPHGAVAYLGWEEFIKQEKSSCYGIILETAHPAKFIDVVEDTLEVEVFLPDALKLLKDKEIRSVKLSKKYDEFYQFLKDR